jgi:hypothetical protein
MVENRKFNMQETGTFLNVYRVKQWLNLSCKPEILAVLALLEPAILTKVPNYQQFQLF